MDNEAHAGQKEAVIEPGGLNVSGISSTEESLDLVVEFIETLAKLFPGERNQRIFRILYQGLFVVEAERGALILAFQKWALEQKGLQLSRDKSARRLFGNEAPRLVYLVEGKHSLPGWMVLVPIRAPQRLGLVHYQGKPLDAFDYLHPRDPIFDQKDQFRADLSTQGLEIVILARSREYRLSLEVLKEFARQARQSGRTVSAYPGVHSALREALKALAGLLSKARRVRDEQRLLIPASYRRGQIVFLGVGAFVFILEAGNRLVRTYELRGRNRHEFVVVETELLRNQSGKLPNRGRTSARQRGPRQSHHEQRQRAGLFEFARQGQSVLGSFVAHGVIYQLQAKAFGPFLDGLVQIHSLQRRVAERFTIYDALQAFCKLFEDAQPIDGRDLQRYLKEPQGGSRIHGFLKSGWVFLVLPGGMIVDSYANDRSQSGQAGDAHAGGRRHDKQSQRASSNDKLGARGRPRITGEKIPKLS